MSGCFFLIGTIFFIVGLVTLFSPDQGQNNPANVADAKLPRINASGTGSTARPGAAASQVVSTPPSGATVNNQSLPNVHIGQRIQIKHPEQGQLTLYVMGRVLYSELWQTSRGAQSPWVPTGNQFAGFWLETNRLLLNWQNRYYLLDESTPTSDAEIGRDFAPHARKFAQSDQTAEVLFSYPPGMWRMVDIGKFRIERVEGEGLRMTPGSVGRFIHAHDSGSGGFERALVVEDYEGGGQDVVWIGVTLQETDINA